MAGRDRPLVLLRPTFACEVAFLLSLYIARGDVASSYRAAGSVVVMLL